MGMPLLSRRWDKDQEELDRVFRGPKQFKWPICKLSILILGADAKLIKLHRVDKLQRSHPLHTSEIPRDGSVVQSKS
jgi:hypothetical protein